MRVEEEVLTQTRRQFLIGASVLAMASAGRSWSREYRGSIPWEPDAMPMPDGYDPSRRFLTGDERRFLTAAVDRLIPKDEFPSASQLGVVEFIDDQLAGSYGAGDIFYIKPPFYAGTDSQGYQSGAPAELYRTAIAEIEEAVTEQHGAPFAELPAGTQDAVLTALEDGDMELPTASAGSFFDMLLQNTREGYFGDPVYGGNRGMQAWRMIGFPGARYEYRPYVARHNEPLTFEPVSVAGFGPFPGDR
jgi:gluconate 2-dehydrogenase gamma chain